MAKEACKYRTMPNCWFIIALILLCCFKSFAQTNSTKDSAKAKTVVTDSSSTSGTTKIVLLHHAKTIPIPALQDADHDGIPEQLDLEPNTPEGAAVDSHGRALDTDGDGVPDYKDKEKLTLQKCFPVDSNGVGRCGDCTYCKEVSEGIRRLDSLVHCCLAKTCGLGTIWAIEFKGDGWSLSTEMKNVLHNVAEALKSHSTCNVKVIAHYGWVTTELAEQLSYDRANAVVKFLVEKEGIVESRIIFEYDQPGKKNIVDLIPTVAETTLKHQ